MRSAWMKDVPNLWSETYDLVAQVPIGRVTTYGAVAKALGDVVASRFVGLAMSRNDDIVRVPCRRVVQSNGHVGGYTGGGPEKKIALLREEGIRIEGSMVADLDRVLFEDFESEYPLRDLRERQRRLRRHLRLRPTEDDIDMVAGIDVAYDGDRSFAAMVTFDFSSGEELDRRVFGDMAKFPYVPTYLAFREIPLIQKLMRRLRKRTVVMYDGHGILHPERFGVTSQVGVTFGVPTVGVAKKLLCGYLGHESPKGVFEVRLGSELLGHAISSPGHGKPVYVSAGHMVSKNQARDIALRFRRHRVPEPTRVAHIVAEAARRGTNHK